MNLEEFEKIVNDTVQTLPDEFRSEIENVGIMIEEWPTTEDLQSVYAHAGVTLFGLYRGVPKTKRGDNYNAILPDKIIIFSGPILQYFHSEQEIKKQIKETVLHELGHYFGMSEEEIRKSI